VPSHLAHAAAFLVAVLVEGEHALGADQLLSLVRIREGVFDVDAVVLLHRVKHAVRLRVQPPGVQAAPDGKVMKMRK